MSREENIRVFQDTENQIMSNTILYEAMQWSTKNQIFIPEDSKVGDIMPNIRQYRNRYTEDATIVVSKKRSYEAASFYAGKIVCVHNFASATNPGGGVDTGSNAQEECLCRCSTLYESLNVPKMWDNYYTPNRVMKNPVHNDDCIYTPSVVVFKSDTAKPKLLKENEWYKVNVVTCAAPNLKPIPGNAMNPGDGMIKANMTDSELLELQEKRLSRILDVAVAGGNEVVILGAFGCGAFENSPSIVAEASRNVVRKYRKSFITIEFAVYCSSYNEQNYEIFRETFQE